MKENKHIIYFDGICGLCNSFVSFLLKIDSSSNLKFATIQGESGQKLLNKMNNELAIEKETFQDRFWKIFVGWQDYSKYHGNYRAIISNSNLNKNHEWFLS